MAEFSWCFNIEIILIYIEILSLAKLIPIEINRFLTIINQSENFKHKIRIRSARQ